MSRNTTSRGGEHVTHTKSGNAAGHLTVKHSQMSCGRQWNLAVTLTLRPPPSLATALAAGASLFAADDDEAAAEAAKAPLTPGTVAAAAGLPLPSAAAAGAAAPAGSPGPAPACV